jgi:ribose transport system ATP-binding protein
VRHAFLTASGVAKRFGGTAALDQVDLTIDSGQVHALLGGNGSGKSTFIKILAGVYATSDGTVEVAGARVALSSWSSAAAHRHRIRFVHQDPALFPGYSVAENMSVGRGWRTAGPQIRWRAAHERAHRALKALGIDISTRALVGSLSRSQQTLVAIARAVMDVDQIGLPGLLVLDEPTASLPDQEMLALVELVKRIAAQGHAVLYVSHRLEEIMAVADYVTVLRDGKVAGRRPMEGVGRSALLEMIVGRPAAEAIRPASAPDRPRTVSLAVRNLSGRRLQDISFDVAQGEVLGIAGLADAGGPELLEAMFGTCPAHGSVSIGGVPMALGNPRSSVRRGIGYVPADRVREGVFATMTIRENVAIGSYGRYFRLGHLNGRRIAADDEALLDSHDVRRADSNLPISTLSGGNQQKVVLARLLRRGPKVLLLDDPTQGVDVAAKREIWALVRRLTDGGACVVVHSTDYEELVDVADRILVLRDGRVSACRPASELDRQRLTELTYSPSPGKAQT